MFTFLNIILGMSRKVALNSEFQQKLPVTSLSFFLNIRKKIVTFVVPSASKTQAIFLKEKTISFQTNELPYSAYTKQYKRIWRDSRNVLNICTIKFQTLKLYGMITAAMEKPFVQFKGSRKTNYSWNVTHHYLWNCSPCLVPCCREELEGSLGWSCCSLAGCRESWIPWCHFDSWQENCLACVKRKHIHTCTSSHYLSCCKLVKEFIFQHSQIPKEAAS